MVEAKKGKLISSSGDIAAYVDRNAAVELNGQSYGATVRSAKCQILTSGTKCPECVHYRDIIRSIHHRWQKRLKTSPSQLTSTHSHVNDRWLKTPERKAKVAKLRQRVRSAESMVKYMKEKIAVSTDELGTHVDDSLHNGLEQIMSELSPRIEKQYLKGTFHRLFWEQQLQAMSQHPTQRRWHPMLIRWCLHLKMISTSAYNALRGVLTLPCGRTLQDYTRWVKADVGIQPEVTEQLRREARVDSLQEWKKYVAVVFDEVKVKEGIVYDKHECRIVGFVDFGDVNNALLAFERSMNGDADRTVAKHMLVFMVRGIFIKLQFPYAQYPTTDLSAELLHPIVWEVVKNLECAGFKVISLTGDKASVNRKFFRMHRSDSKSDEVTFKVRNPYSIEKRFIYFISDVPHLIKTTRNCWSNSFCHSYKRALWVCTSCNLCTPFMLL